MPVIDADTPGGPAQEHAMPLEVDMHVCEASRPSLPFGSTGAVE
jgi:hypothetical protein